MHSAFLLTNGVWERTMNPAKALDHAGDLLINEDEDEAALNLELLGAREGKEARLWNNRVVLTDTKIHYDLDAAYAELLEFGKARCQSANRFEIVELPKEGKKFATYVPCSYWGEEENEEHLAKWRGIVAVNESNNWLVFRDEKLWEVCEEARKQRCRQQHLRWLREKTCKYDFEKIADECAVALGCCVVKSFRIEQFWTWLVAHDAVFGRRATNKLVLDVAKKWCNDRTKSKKWLARFSCEEVAERTDQRLASVLRLGDRNSRLKKR